VSDNPIKNAVEKQKIKVKFDDATYQHLNTTEWNSLQLLPEDKCIENNNKLIKEFNDVMSKIEEQMKIAAKAIDKANEIANNKDYDLVHLYDQTSELMNSLESVGWSTSSMSC